MANERLCGQREPCAGSESWALPPYGLIESHYAQAHSRILVEPRVTKLLDGTVALVTGASSGIGAATARKLARLGTAVAAVARRKERLDQLVGQIEKASGTALPIEASITDRSWPAAAAHEAVERALKKDLVSQSSTCDLCGPRIVLIDDAALDHELEYWRGGRSVPENVRLVHRQCNLDNNKKRSI